MTPVPLLSGLYGVPRSVRHPQCEIAIPATDCAPLSGHLPRPGPSPGPSAASSPTTWPPPAARTTIDTAAATMAIARAAENLVRLIRPHDGAERVVTVKEPLP
jgi:hypothetical protein